MIRQLPSCVIDKVRTGVSLSSLPQALVALLANSLDAHPTNILVELDVPNGFISVNDDGEGVQGDLNLVGRRYCTSKDANDGSPRQASSSHRHD